MNGFCNINSLKTLNRGSTCFKNSNNPSCIDFFVTNRQQCFQQTHAVETGIFGSYRKIVAVMKLIIKSKKQKPANAEITNIFMNNLLIWAEQWVTENWY